LDHLPARAQTRRGDPSTGHEAVGESAEGAVGFVEQRVDAGGAVRGWTHGWADCWWGSLLRGLRTVRVSEGVAQRQSGAAQRTPISTVEVSTVEVTVVGSGPRICHGEDVAQNRGDVGVDSRSSHSVMVVLAGGGYCTVGDAGEVAQGEVHVHRDATPR